MGNVNGVEMLHAALASRLPGAQVTVETPQQPNGSWWIDVYLKGKSASVEWRPAHGYGVAGEVTASGERLDFVLHVRGEHGAHAAAGGGEGHLHLHVVPASFGGDELAEIDQSEVDDVHRDLRVVTGLELIPDELLELLGLDLLDRCGL